MHVSLHFSPQSRGAGEDAVLIEDLVERTVLAEQAGIASISLTEHHLGGFNTYSDPFMLGCYLAPRMGDMYVAIMVVQVPLDHPLRIVERTNLLDVVTKGRCLVALGSGSPRQLELDSFGVDFADRSAMTEARIDAMVRAWGWDEASSPVDLATPYDVGRIDARVTPAPYRQPHPLVGRATGTDAVLLDCARRGWPAFLALAAGEVTPEALRQVNLYRDALLEAGHPDHVVDECLAWLGPITLVSLADTEQEARRRFDTYMEVGGEGPIVTDAAAGTAQWVNEWRMRQDQKAAHTYCGTPEMVVEHIRQSCEAVGSNHMRVLLLDIPGRDEENLDSHRMLLDEVVPQLDPEPLPGPVRTLAPLG